MSDHRIRLALADDHPLFRDGVRRALEVGPEFDVVGEVGEGEAAVQMVLAEAPDVLLLDLLLPGMDGATVLDELRRDARLAAVRVVVTTGLRTAHLRKLLHPDALLFKPFGIDELVLAVASVAQPQA